MTADPLWGTPDVQLLPSSLADGWAGETLPAWVTTLALLPPGTRISSLSSPLPVKLPKNDWDHLVRFVLNFVSERVSTIRSIRAVQPFATNIFTLEDVRWSVRTSNALRQSGLLDHPDELARFTFGKLLDVPNLGIRSVLDFAVMLEIFLEQSSRHGDDTAVEETLVPEAEKRAVLTRIADSSWADLISHQDRRFSDLLSTTTGTVAEHIEEVLDRADPMAIDLLWTRAAELESRITHIQSLSLEQVLFELFTVTAKTKRDRLPALIRRFGWDGKPPETLEQVGQRLGVTRERIRQIQAKTVRRLPQHQMFIPQLELAIETLEAAAPLSPTDASKLILEKGVSERPFHPKSIVAAAADCNLPTSLRVHKIRGKSLVTAKTSEGVALRIASIAKKQCGASGATDITEVLDQARSEGLAFEEERASRLIRNLPDLHWLEDEWFWSSSIPINRNRLRNVARKMLSVTSPIHAKKIRIGMRRVAAWRNSTVGEQRWPFRAPPTNIVHQLLEQHAEFDVNHIGLVRPVDDLDYVAELGDAERAMVEAIRSTPTHILDRQSIRDRSIKRGANPHSVEVLLSYSPLIEHLGVNLWTIAGTVVDPTALEAVRAANALRPREKRVSDFGWTETGNIWVAVIIPSYHTSSFVFGIPGGVKRFLVRQKFCIRDEFGRNHGNVGVTEDGAAYGAGPFLRRKSADAGDTMLCEFDLANNSVLIRLGGEEIKNVL